MEIPVTAGEMEYPPVDAITESWFSNDAIGDNERHNPGEVHHISDDSGNLVHHMDNYELIHWCIIYIKLCYQWTL